LSALDAYGIRTVTVDSTREDHGLDPVPAGQRVAVILRTDDCNPVQIVQPLSA
jgi:hypothetical protein